MRKNPFLKTVHLQRIFSFRAHHLEQSQFCINVKALHLCHAPHQALQSKESHCRLEVFDTKIDQVLHKAVISNEVPKTGL